MGINELSSLEVLLGFNGYKRVIESGVLLDFDGYKRVVESGSYVRFRWVQTNCLGEFRWVLMGIS